MQQQLFGRAIAKLEEAGEPINRVLEVDIAGDEVIFTFYELPSEGGG